MALQQLIYVSAARGKFSAVQLGELLDHCRRRNPERGVTGMLIYHDGGFLQLLEGEEDTLSALYEKIRMDPRHKDARVLMRAPIAERLFPDWAMGFREVGDTEADRPDNVFHLTREALDAKMGDAGDAMNRILVDTFARVNAI